jgi:cytochrome c2
MKRPISILLASTLFLFSCGQNQQGGGENGNTVASQADNGKQLFMNNCVQCHSISQDKMGPKLGGVITRWNGDTAQLVSYIKSSQQVITSGSNPRVTKLFHDWNEATMPAFPNLSDKDIKDIISYINQGVD